MSQNRNILIAFSLLLGFASCKKEGNNDNPNVAPTANLMVVHAAPVPTGFDAIHVYLDTGRVTSTAISYLGNNQATGTTGSLFYMPVIAGKRNLDVRPSLSPAVKVVDQSVSLESSRNYTYFIYDTLNTATGRFKLLPLMDDLSQPADTSLSKIRFLHLAPGVANVDVTFVRLSGTTEVDSVTFANRPYVGSTNPDVNMLSTFTNVKGGTYRARVKTPGTGTVIATINNTTSNFLNFAKGKGYTVYVTGTAKGQPLALRSVRHF
jgi:hypothetical protein